MTALNQLQFDKDKDAELTVTTKNMVAMVTLSATPQRYFLAAPYPSFFPSLLFSPLRFTCSFLHHFLAFHPSIFSVSLSFTIPVVPAPGCA